MLYIFLGLALFCIIFEIFIPTMFFLNFAFAAFICAFLTNFINNIYGLVGIFCILSILFILLLRPLFLSKKDETEKTGMEAKYIGKTAKVIEKIDKNNGAITIYDERWQARNIENDTIEVGETVEIIGYNSLIMQVKRVNR